MKCTVHVDINYLLEVKTEAKAGKSLLSSSKSIPYDSNKLSIIDKFLFQYLVI